MNFHNFSNIFIFEILYPTYCTQNIGSIIEILRLSWFYNGRCGMIVDKIKFFEGSQIKFAFYDGFATFMSQMLIILSVTVRERLKHL